MFFSNEYLHFSYMWRCRFSFSNYLIIAGFKDRVKMIGKRSYLGQTIENLMKEYHALLLHKLIFTRFGGVVYNHYKNTGWNTPSWFTQAICLLMGVTVEKIGNLSRFVVSKAVFFSMLNRKFNPKMGNFLVRWPRTFGNSNQTNRFSISISSSPARLT